MRLLKKIIRDARWKKYCEKHKKIAADYIENNNLIIGATYSGKHFLGKKIYSGILTEICSSSDGIFACIDDKEDILANSLVKISRDDS